MMTKIAVITTEFLRNYIDRTMKALNLDIEYRIFPYSHYTDVADVYRSIPDSYEAVMTSGIFPATVVRRNFPDTDKLITAFGTDDAGLFRLLLELMTENDHFDFSRVYLDIEDLTGIRLRDYIKKEYNVPYVQLGDGFAQDMELDKLYEIEEKEIEIQRALFQSGKIDISVIRFSSIVEQLRKEGYRVYFPFPSTEYIGAVVKDLIQKIQIRHLEENRPAVINIALDDKRINEGTLSIQHQMLSLNEALLDYIGGSLLDYTLQQTHFGFEILTNRRILDLQTKHFTVSDLEERLKKRIGFRAIIGYGIGNDMYQARFNAMNAEREASLNAAGSYLINEHEELIGPLGQDTQAAVSVRISDPLKEASKAAGLSPLTVSRIVSAIRSMPEQCITANELSRKLGITQRSANRFFKALTESGAVEIIAEKRATTKGRPERVFGLAPALKE